MDKQANIADFNNHNYYQTYEEWPWGNMLKDSRELFMKIYLQMESLNTQKLVEDRILEVARGADGEIVPWKKH